MEPMVSPIRPSLIIWSPFSGLIVNVIRMRTFSPLLAFHHLHGATGQIPAHLLPTCRIRQSRVRSGCLLASILLTPIHRAAEKVHFQKLIWHEERTEAATPLTSSPMAVRV